MRSFLGPPNKIRRTNGSTRGVPGEAPLAQSMQWTHGSELARRFFQKQGWKVGRLTYPILFLLKMIFNCKTVR